MNLIRVLPLILTLLLLTVCGNGCVRRYVILVPPGEAVRLAEPVKAKVFVLVNGEWVLGDNQVEIPAGWGALPEW